MICGNIAIEKKVVRPEGRFLHLKICSNIFNTSLLFRSSQVGGWPQSANSFQTLCKDPSPDLMKYKTCRFNFASFQFALKCFHSFVLRDSDFAFVIYSPP